MESQFKKQLPGNELIENGTCPLLNKGDANSEKCGCSKKKKGGVPGVKKIEKSN